MESEDLSKQNIDSIDKNKEFLAFVFLFQTREHFLDYCGLMILVEDIDIDALPSIEKEVIEKYVADFETYKKGQKKFLTILHTEGGLKKILNDKKLLSNG